jgi:galactonate dehydratase
VTGKPATGYEVIRQQLLPLPGLQAAVNVALLDILGRKAKAPICQVLGGPTRFKVRASAVLEGETDEALVTSLKRAHSSGFRAFLVPVPRVQARNQGQAFVQTTRKRLDSLRSAGGDEVDFILDGAGGLSPGDASSLAHELERFHLLWFDEPCRLSNLSAARKIASETVTALGFGRHLHDAGAFQDLLREELIDVLRPSVALNGISQIRRMATLAEAYYVAMAPHHNGGPIATAAALHLAASLPNFFIQQIPLPVADEDRRMRAELTGASIERVTDGFCCVAHWRGLGHHYQRGCFGEIQGAASMRRRQFLTGLGGCRLGWHGGPWACECIEFLRLRHASPCRMLWALMPFVASASKIKITNMKAFGSISNARFRPPLRLCETGDRRWRGGLG